MRNPFKLWEVLRSWCWMLVFQSSDFCVCLLESSNFIIDNKDYQLFAFQILLLSLQSFLLEVQIQSGLLAAPPFPQE